MASTFEPSASARPFVTSGIALAMPPVPVRVPTPAPVAPEPGLEGEAAARRDRAAALPKVTYWLVPFSCSAVPALADGVALTAADAGERPPALSTATTTYW